MTFREWVEDKPKVPPDKLAKRAVNEIPELLLEVVEEEIEHLRREAVRVIESQNLGAFLKAMQGSAASTRTVVIGSRPEQQIVLLLQSRFALGDGTKVTWGQATIDQHRQRIDMLRAMLSGISETIERHELAIARLEEAGAKCLDELMPPEAAA